MSESEAQMARLTLSVDDQVVARARRYAKSAAFSISKMVEGYLAAVAEPASPTLTRNIWPPGTDEAVQQKKLYGATVYNWNGAQ